MGKSRAEYMREYRLRKSQEKLRIEGPKPIKIFRNSTQRTRDLRARQKNSILLSIPTFTEVRCDPSFAASICEATLDCSADSDEPPVQSHFPQESFTEQKLTSILKLSDHNRADDEKEDFEIDWQSHNYDDEDESNVYVVIPQPVEATPTSVSVTTTPSPHPAARDSASDDPAALFTSKNSQSSERVDDPTTLPSTSESLTQPHVPPIHLACNQCLTILPDGAEPIDYFFHLFYDDIFDLVIRETNVQGNFLKTQSSENSRMQKWKDFTRQDFEIFLGLLFLTGHIAVPTLTHYWEVNKLYNFIVFRHAMSCDRFLSILRALCFSRDSLPNEPKSTDPLSKISPLMDLFHQRMKDIYCSTKQSGLDETLLLWRGVLDFKPCIQSKRRKSEAKLYMLAQLDGLVLKFKIYCESKHPFLGCSRRMEKVIENLVEDHLGIGQSVYMEDSYSSVSVTKFLLEKTYVTKALKNKKKESSSEEVNRRLKMVEVESVLPKERICVLNWRDKQDVIMISSKFGRKLDPMKSGADIISSESEAVQQCNGVTDKLLNYYPCERNALRWYAKVGIHMFHIMMNNAFLLYKKYGGNKNITLLEFRDQVISSLIYKNLPEIGNIDKRLSNEVHIPPEVERNKK